ncbi:MAG TPA: class I SAM-dependent methyltransferase [Bacteroidales bacterium]|nr:class I SAM-dependent methyltransferase [Bacteroidales bacterium]
MPGILQTAERVSHKDMSDNYVFQRSVLAYHKASELISGRVLEIGTGSGYGIEIISEKASEFVTIDKHNEHINLIAGKGQNVKFVQMKVPPFKGIDDKSFDFVISFQVIEHIKNDKAFVKEVARVLKPGGRFIVTTPNKQMSLTRNPWHVREYLPEELEILLHNDFKKIEKYGVFGNEKIMSYYRKNKENVRKFTRYDILNLQYNLPRFFLQIPYDILNRINRKRLLKQNMKLVSDISMNDYFTAPVGNECFDLFYIAEK